jgi:hypothetical protein
MKTKTTHKSNLGIAGAHIPSDFQGYIEYHDSPRYARMTLAELDDLADSTPYKTVEAAIAIERAHRVIAASGKK